MMPAGSTSELDDLERLLESPDEDRALLCSVTDTCENPVAWRGYCPRCGRGVPWCDPHHRSIPPTWFGVVTHSGRGGCGADVPPDQIVWIPVV